jgi:hypothetical protein
MGVARTDRKRAVLQAVHAYLTEQLHQATDPERIADLRARLTDLDRALGGDRRTGRSLRSRHSELRDHNA